MSPARKIEAHLVKLARKHDGFCRKVRWVGRNGCPDRLLVETIWGLMWVEVKAPGKEPTKQQLAEHEKMRRVGQDVRVIDSIAKVEELFA